jgi:hypothetical protein
VPNLLVTATTRYDPKGLNKAKKDIKGFDKTIKALGKTFLGLFAAQKMLAFGKASVKAFAADDKAARMLANTLKNVGQAYAATGVEDFIAKLQSATGVLDDSLRPALQILLTATGDVTKSQSALALALDVSQATGKDLSAVSTALAKGFQGNTTALAKMGGAVSKATLATGDMNKITAELTAKYKGSALTAAAGYSGQMDKLAVASANAKEIIGKGLLNSLSLLGGEGGIGSVTNAIDELSTGLSEAIVSTTKLIAELKKLPVVGSYLSRIIANPLNLPTGALAFGKGGMMDKARAYGRTNVKTGYGQQSPGDRNLAVATNKKLQLQKAQELATLLAKNKATKEEAQMKKDQAALDALKAKFDLERIGLNAALLNATDEETKARIKAQIAILDESGKTAQAANDALVKAQADKLKNELAAADALGKLATATGLATTALGMYRTALTPGAVINKAEAIAKIGEVTGGAATGGGGGANTAVGTIIKATETTAAAIAEIVKTDKDTKDGSAATVAAITETAAAVAAIITATETTTEAIAAITKDLVTIIGTDKDTKDAIGTIVTAVEAIITATDDTLKPGDFVPTNNVPIMESIFGEINTAAMGAFIDAVNAFANAKDGGITVTINDNTSGLIEIVQDAVVDNTRNGNNLFVAGSI